MEAYTGKQRVAAAFKKTFTDQDIELDRIPAYPIMGQCNAQLVGASIRELLLDPKIFVKAQVAASATNRTSSSCRRIYSWMWKLWAMS